MIDKKQLVIMVFFSLLIVILTIFTTSCFYKQREAEMFDDFTLQINDLQKELSKVKSSLGGDGMTEEEILQAILDLVEAQRKAEELNASVNYWKEKYDHKGSGGGGSPSPSPAY